MRGDKVCVVTGGASGIGKCIVDAFIKNKYSVAVIDVAPESCNMLSTEYPYDNFTVFCGDIAEKDDLEKFCTKVIDTYGRVDCLINNACLSKNGLLSDCSYEDFNYVLRVGISAPYYLAKCFMPYFQPTASIVNISSTRAAMSQADTESYSAAKGGISALTHAMCMSFAGKVRVNSISPGWINTGSTENLAEEDHQQHPSGRVGKPNDIASMVLYLCSEAALFVNGENITIDGGMSRQMIYHNDHGWKLDY